MSPSFYQSTPSPNLLSDNRPVETSNMPPDKGLPTLAVVLGLIGVLVGLAFVASIFIYIFRGRLFAPPPEPTDEEKLHVEAETKGIYGSSGCLGHFSGPPVLPSPGLGASIGNGPPLRPVLLEPTKRPESQYKQLLLPRLQQVQSDLASKRCTTIPTMRDYNAPRARGSDVFTARRDLASASLKVSQSCPGRIAQFVLRSPKALRESVPSLATVGSTTDKRRESTHKLFPPPPTLMYSYESMSSVYSEDSVYSTSSSGSSVDWDYYINDRHEGLFYEPPEAAEETTGESGSASTDTSLDSIASIKTGISTRRIHCAVPLSKRASRVSPEDKKHSRLARRHATRRQHASRAGQLFDLKRRVSKTYVKLHSNPPSGQQFVPKYGERAGAESPKTCSATPSPDKAAPTTPTYLERTPPRTSSRHALNILLDSPLSVMAKHLNVRREPVISPPAPRQQPSILLNDRPADDLTTMSPPRFQKVSSPPRDPELLNTKWKPRPATPQLSITVFSRTRSPSYALSSSHPPGRRVNITPPAGISLAELRGLIERALGHDVRTLRGKVFIGTRAMFLPLVSERFFAQWVRERIRDGGSGVVEAWYT